MSFAKLISLATAFADELQWLIWPSVENMNAMPEWLMPLARQDCSAYDLLVDLIPWYGLLFELHPSPVSNS